MHFFIPFRSSSPHCSPCKIPLFAFHFSFFSNISILFLLFASHLLTVSALLPDSYTSIFVLKSPSVTDTVSPQEYLYNKVDEFSSLLPSSKILYIYSHFADLEFYAFSAQWFPSDLETLENHFSESLKFYEHSSSLEISRSLVKTVPFVSQFLRSETFTLAKNGFCTFSYEAYDHFTMSGIRESGENDSMLDIYILDTGIQSSHVAFGNRVLHGFDAISDPPLQSDPNGHGTQVAGIIGGEFYGLVNSANLIDVRVADENGIAQIHQIIAGLDYVIGRFLSQIEKKGRLSSVTAMSLSGAQSRVMKYALFSFSKAMLLVGPAGDNDSFSCGYTPANSPFVLITAATLRDLDLERQESNFGDCIDINAPGDMIPSPWIGPSNTEESHLSGSSASTAVITGVLGVVITVLRSHPSVEYNGEQINLFEEFSTSLQPENFPILLRNILLASAHQFPSTSSARESHPTSATYCDLRSIDSIIVAARDYHRKLKATDKTSPISRVKQNFLNHQKQKLETQYE